MQPLLQSDSILVRLSYEYEAPPSQIRSRLHHKKKDTLIFKRLNNIIAELYCFITQCNNCGSVLVQDSTEYRKEENTEKTKTLDSFNGQYIYNYKFPAQKKIRTNTYFKRTCMHCWHIEETIKYGSWQPCYYEIIYSSDTTNTINITQTYANDIIF